MSFTRHPIAEFSHETPHNIVGIIDFDIQKPNFLRLHFLNSILNQGSCQTLAAVVLLDTEHEFSTLRSKIWPQLGGSTKNAVDIRTDDQRRLDGELQPMRINSAIVHRPAETSVSTHCIELQKMKSIIFQLRFTQFADLPILRWHRSTPRQAIRDFQTEALKLPV